jgi:hypothetical protein
VVVTVNRVVILAAFTVARHNGAQLSLAKKARRGLELFLARFSKAASLYASWRMPKIKGGGLKVRLLQLCEIAADDGSARCLGA